MSYFAQEQYTDYRRANQRAAGAQIMSPKAAAANNGSQTDRSPQSPYRQQQMQQQQLQQQQSPSRQQQQQQQNNGSYSARGTGGGVGGGGAVNDAGLTPSEAAAEQQAVNAALAANQCICDICTCGKHHCPAEVHLQARYDPSLASSYRDSFPKHQSSIVRAHAPPSTVFSSGDKFTGGSVTKQDYSGAPGRPATLWKPDMRSNVGGEEDRAFQSENSSNYKSHGFVRRGIAVPNTTMQVSNEPFQGESTTKQDYQRWSGRPAEPIKPFSNEQPREPDNRDFATENASKFNTKGYVARQQTIPFTSHVFDSDVFQGESSMKDAYKQWNQHRPPESFKPQPTQAEQRPDDRQFRTEKQDNYTPKGPAGVIRMHAPPSQVLESAPFAGASVSKTDFSGPRGAPATLWKPELKTTVGAEESRDFQSENSTNYKSHGFVRRGIAIPNTTMTISNEPFQGESTTKEHYQRWSGGRPAEPVKPFTNDQPRGPDDRDFATENASKFNSKGYVARQPAIPFTSHVFEHGAVRNFETEHGAHYSSKFGGGAGTASGIDPTCPSDALMRNRAQNPQQFGKTKTVAGHLLYHHDAESRQYVPVPADEQQQGPMRK